MLLFAAGRVSEQDRLGSVLELAVEEDGALNRLHLVLGIVLLVGDEETRVQVLIVRQRVAFLLRRTVHEIALFDRLVQTGVFNYCDLLYDFDVLDALPIEYWTPTGFECTFKKSRLCWTSLDLIFFSTRDNLYASLFQ